MILIKAYPKQSKSIENLHQELEKALAPQTLLEIMALFELVARRPDMQVHCQMHELALNLVIILHKHAVWSGFVSSFF